MILIETAFPSVQHQDFNREYKKLNRGTIPPLDSYSSLLYYDAIALQFPYSEANSHPLGSNTCWIAPGRLIHGQLRRTASKMASNHSQLSREIIKTLVATLNMQEDVPSTTSSTGNGQHQTNGENSPLADNRNGHDHPVADKLEPL